MAKVTINKRELMNAVRLQAKTEVKRLIEPAIRRRIIIAQKKMIEEFEEHEVTLEIKRGSSDPIGTPNISRTLEGYGNLFTFIGFKRGTDPTRALRKVLDEPIQFSLTTSRTLRDGTLSYSFRVELPSILGLEAATPIPWSSGESWAEGIEKGISGVGQYLALKVESSRSRSGGGLQIKGTLPHSFNTRPYLSQIVKAFVEAL